MINLTISVVGAMKAIEIVRIIKDAGYKIGQDFDFEYVTERDDENKISRFTVFHVYQESLSSWIALKFL